MEALHNAPAAAWTPDQGPGIVLDGLIAQIDSDQYEVRESATRALVESDEIRLADLELILQTRKLSLEQRQRLTTAARDRFVNSPRAGMGVQFFLVLHTRVIVDKMVETFPAAKVLEPGDLIVEINGERLEGPSAQAAIRRNIICRDPGDELDVVIRRGEQRLRLRVPLGDYSKLQNNRFFTLGELMSAWETRSADYSQSPMPIAVANAPAPGKWPRHEDPNQDLFDQPLRPRAIARQVVALSPRIVGGGMARQTALEGQPAQATMPAQQQLVIIRNGNVIVADPRRGFAQVQQGFVDAPNGAPMTVAEELSVLANQERLLREARAKLPGDGAEGGAVQDPLPGGGPLAISDLDRRLATIRKVQTAIKAEEAERRQSSQAQGEEAGN